MTANAMLKLNAAQFLFSSSEHEVLKVSEHEVLKVSYCDWSTSADQTNLNRLNRKSEMAAMAVEIYFESLLMNDRAN